jgi:anti-sigma regulatory factor (Ser/Thr protein kinase)
MANDPHTLIPLPNRSYQALARASIKKMALAAGFKPKRIAELEIVVAELTSNIIKHTHRGGQLLVKQLESKGGGIEIIAIDEGPGMETVAKMMEDGQSSTNTLGHGLGAIKRLADEFDIYSQKDWGTISLVRMFVDKPDSMPKKKAVYAGIIMVAKEGETVCGDNFYCIQKLNSLRFAACDGLGHGPNADEAARMCMEVFEENISLTPVEQIRAIHQKVKRTRGAVIYLTHFDFQNKQLNYCGVGNIGVKILSPGKPRNCVSYNGIVGYSIPGTLNSHFVPWSKTDMAVIHSDGLSSRWDLQKHPTINRHDNSIIAAALFKDFYRKTDDVLIAVISQTKKTYEN